MYSKYKSCNILISNYINNKFLFLGANRVSTVFPVITLVLLVTGFTVSAIGNIQGDIKTLIGSVVYISGGNAFIIGYRTFTFQASWYMLSKNIIVQGYCCFGVLF